MKFWWRHFCCHVTGFAFYKSTISSNGGEAINTGMGAVLLKGTPYEVNKNCFLSAMGIPYQKPSFGTLSAIDVKMQQYVSPKNGKQYILISAGGGRQSPDRGDYVIAYVLP